MTKYKLELEIETEEELEDVEELLKGCWLYDSDFRGAITNSELKLIQN